MVSCHKQTLRVLLAAGLNWHATSPKLSIGQGLPPSAAAGNSRFSELRGKLQIADAVEAASLS